MKKFFQSYFVEILIIFVFSLLPLFWLHGGEIVLGHDANYRMNHAERMVSSVFSWNDMSYYGTDWTYDRGYLPINLIQLVLLKITPSFSAMQSIFFVFLFLVLGYSMYALAVGVFPEPKQRPLRLIASIFSMFNFFILQGWFTADTGRFLIFAGLPLFILVIHNLFTEVWSQKKSFLVFAILSFFFNGNGLPPLVGFEVIAIGITGILYAIFRIKKYHWSGVIFSIKSAALCLTIFFCINAYWLLPVMNFTSGSYTSSVSSSGGVEGTLAWEQMISKYASFSNLFRLQGIADWYDNANHAYAQAYLTNPVLIFLSFIPILTILSGLWLGKTKQLVSRQKHLIYLLLSLWVFGLFMSAGTHAPFGKIYESFMRYIPGFVIFRSSLYKFGFALWVPMIFLFAYFCGEYIQMLTKKIKPLTLFTLVVIVGIVGFHYPYFSPEKVFHFNHTFKTRFILPSYVTDMCTYIDTHVSSSSRILLLPELDREYIGVPMDAYSWGYYSMILLPNFISNSTYIADKESDTIIQMIYRSIYAGDIATFNTLVQKTGISHILFRRDVQLSPGSEKMHPIADVEKRLQFLSSVQIDYEVGNWVLYAISTRRDIPMVTTLSSFDMLLPPTLNSTYLMARNNEEGHGFIQAMTATPKAELQQGAKKEIIEAECYFCKKDEYIGFVNGIGLPIKRNIPLISEMIASRKEKQNLARTVDSPKERIDVDLSLAQQKLATIVRVTQTGAGSLIIIREQYRAHVQDAVYNLKSLSGRDRNLYATRIKAYLESQVKTLADYNLRDEENSITTYIQELEKDTWYTTDVTHLRFGFTITTPSMYGFYIPDAHLYETYMSLDGVYVPISQLTYLTEGYHKVEIWRRNTDTSIYNGIPALFVEKPLSGETISTPKITYEKINPTEYIMHVEGSTGPFIMQLNQQYDMRWSAYLASTQITKKNAFIKTLQTQPVPNDTHIKVNGYANGWYISKEGDFDVIVSYEPQKIFYVGFILSSITLFTVVIIISVLIRKRYEKK